MKAMFLLPILNIAAFLLAIFLGKSVTRGKAYIWTLLAVIPSWVIAMTAMVQQILGHAPVLQSIPWFDFGVGVVRMGVEINGLTVVMGVVVTTISMMVQIYSIGYMRGEVRFVQFFATLSLFTTGMLVLVLADNLFLAIFGWEIMGFCSYQLIAHYWEKKENSNAGIKAFITTRTGDLGLVIGTIICFWTVRTFNILAINQSVINDRFAGTVLVVACVALFIGVIGKSAQVPLQTWLPDAMAGPTPVSALIHAATMVVAGVFLIARLYPVFFDGFKIATGGIPLIPIIGGLTVLVGALIAIVQTDIKKVLAYSTISQLGYMVMALGVGAWGAGVFHLFTHAFFKGLLFLVSGSVIHGVHDQDMRNMGGLRKLMPSTFWTWMIGTIALCGIFPFAGFFSKDEILAGAYHNGYAWVYAVGLIGAFLTAFYMFRATYLTFAGKYRGHGHPHESEGLITGPLWFLAVPSFLIGWIGIPSSAAWFGLSQGKEGALSLFDKWFEPAQVTAVVDKANTAGASIVPHGVGWEWLALAAVSTLVAGSGVVLATWLFHPRWAKNRGITERVPVVWARHALEAKLGFDYVYGGLVYAIRDPMARAMNWVNQNVIDVVLDLTAAGTLEAGKGSYWIDQSVLDGFYNGSAHSADRSGRYLRRAQTGKVQQYAAVFFAAAALIGLVLVLTQSLGARR